MVDTLEGCSLKCDDSWYDSMCAYEFKSWCWSKFSYKVDKLLLPFENAEWLKWNVLWTRHTPFPLWEWHHGHIGHLVVFMMF